MDPLVRYVPLVEAGVRITRQQAEQRVVQYYAMVKQPVRITGTALDLSRSVLPIDMWRVTAVSA